MDEIGLIRAAKKGDLNAFNRLVLNYQELIYNQAYRIMGEQPSAEDATQEAMIKAYKNIRSFRGGSFRAWLLTIVTNGCYDEIRRRKRRPTVPLEPLNQDDEEIESPVWLTDPSEGPEDAAERSDLRNALHHCLGSLPDDFRLVVILVDIQGLDYAETAQVIGKPVGTVKSRLARARVRMQDCLMRFRELFPIPIRLEREGIP